MEWAGKFQALVAHQVLQGKALALHPALQPSLLPWHRCFPRGWAVLAAMLRPRLQQDWPQLAWGSLRRSHRLRLLLRPMEQRRLRQPAMWLASRPSARSSVVMSTQQRLLIATLTSC